VMNFDATHASNPIPLATDKLDAFTYTVDLGPSHIAASNASNAGGASIVSTYSQTCFRIYERRFWVKMIGRDALQRPIIGQDEFQGEVDFNVNHAAQGWTKRAWASWYTEPVIPTDPSVRLARGRAPAWATHMMMLLDLQNVGAAHQAAPPPLYLTDFFANEM